MEAEDAPSAAPGPLTPGQLRLARLTLEYLLDSIEISRGGGDIVDRLLVAAIIDANVGPIKQDASLQSAYAAIDAAPPETLFRPVSINAVAQSLGLPFETVRRRVSRLADAGACVVTPRGLLVPQANLATPAFKAMSLARYERLRRFYLDLSAQDALPDVQRAPAGRTPPGDAPVRVANRVLAEHLMRFIESVMARIGDPLTGMVALHVARQNVQHIPPAGLGGDGQALAAQARPVTSRRLGALLNIPPETVRRRTAALVQSGVCRRTPAGVIVAFEQIERPEVVQFVEESAANVRRLFARLDRLGVLSAWDAEGNAGLTAPAH